MAAELHRDVLALARGLLRLGTDEGGRVGIWAPNCPEWTLLQYAAQISAILVPINPPTEPCRRAASGRMTNRHR